VTYQPSANFTGTDSFAYTISDGTLTATAVVTVTVTAVNDAPTATNDAATTVEDTEVVIDVLANDTDLDGDPLTVSAVGAPAHGSTTLVTTGPNAGRISYLPSPNFVGTDVFTYTVSDNHGATATATVTVTVSAVNDAPVAANDAASVAEDSAVVIDVLANDTDVDGDTLSVTGVSAPAHGVAAVVTSGPDAGRVRYTPQTNFFGTDSFTYTISDGAGGTATGLVAVTITPVNDAPIAANDSATTLGPAPVTINVLANDSDPDGDPLSVTAIGAPAHGIAMLLTVGPDAGKVSYVAEVGFAGSDSFTYTITDGVLTATATVTVIVSPVE